jgi:hypothetical protein
VDGVTWLVLGEGPDVRPGDFVKVELSDAHEHDLVGTVLAR